MADKIKAFFQKKIKDKQFKNAGKGHSLLESKNQEPSSSKRKTEVVQKRQEQSTEARIAGQAALSRLEGNKPPPLHFNVSQKAIQKQVRRELENESRIQNSIQETSTETAAKPKPSSSEPDQDSLAITGVFYRCPIVSNEVLSRKEWLPKIHEFIKEQLQADDEGVAACLIIRNCNLNEYKINKCVEILCKYLENIVNHPEEQKYWKIRLSNKIFQEKVMPIEGALDLLSAAGFRHRTLTNDGVEEEFLVWDPEISTVETVSMLAEAVTHSEIIELELDRNAHVFLRNHKMKSELPKDFFTMSVSEISNIQHERTEALERSQMLMTKAYREQEKQKNTRIYKFSLIRIRFPDGIILQGTFSVEEKCGNILEFLREHLKFSDFPFTLVTPIGAKLSVEDEEKTLSELKLVPAVILVFSWNSDDASKIPSEYLKEESLQFVEDL